MIGVYLEGLLLDIQNDCHFSWVSSFVVTMVAHNIPPPAITPSAVTPHTVQDDHNDFPPIHKPTKVPMKLNLPNVVKMFVHREIVQWKEQHVAVMQAMHAKM